MSKEKWICGWSEDNWDGCDEFSTKEEAIEWGRSEYETYDIDGFFVGVKKDCILDADIIDVESILEEINQECWDNFGEYANDYLLDSTDAEKDELSKELNQTFHKWIKKYNKKPRFFEVIKVEEVSLDESEDDENVY